MSDILPFLKSLISTSGLSGFEAPAAELIEQKWAALADEVSRGRLGSVRALKRGRGAGSSRPSVLVSTHMDSIGLMISALDEGFARVINVGGVDPRILPGTPVIVHASKTNEELYGVLAMPPANLLPEGKGTGVIGTRYLVVDTGLTPREVEKRVQVGDRVSFATPPLDLAGGCLSGHTLDNRASVAALTVCLEELQNKAHEWDLWAVASAQEEVTMAGARTSAYDLRPTLAVAVDVTFGKGGGANGWETFPIGKGVTLGISPVIHPALFKRFKEIAERFEIPVKEEAMPQRSGTDGDALQLAAEGIPTMVLGIPLRYMHTPVETVSVKDVQRAGRLLAEFVASLESDFINKIVWD